MKAVLSQTRVLIVDANPKTRSQTLRVLLALGAQTDSVTLASDFDEALIGIHNMRPTLVITEYGIPKGSGIQLASEFNKTKSTNAVFVILTENKQQSSVVIAAEEDVDGYILKPYTVGYFSKTLERLVRTKQHPSEYKQKINQGKALLAEKSWDQAIHHFNLAIQVGTSPALAYYYRSQAEIQKLLYDVAETSLRSGLTHHESHYKCLQALLDLLLERNRLKDAYEVVRKLIRFPLSTKKLVNVIGLAIKTANYTDIEKYYEVFKNIEVKDVELIKSMNAALVISSKMLFQRGEMYKAASYLKKASTTASEHPTILLEIVTTLALQGFTAQAKEAIKRFSTTDRTGFQYRISCAMIAYGENPDSSRHIEQLRAVLDSGLNEPACYFWLIAFLRASGKTEIADQYTAKARSQWPDRHDYFAKATEAVPQRKKEPVKSVY